ncbi:MAG: ABC transporter permease subunit, partial [Trebonia sp.]
MNWQNVATIARKDLTVMMTRRSLRIGLLVLPVGLAILFSQIIAHGNFPGDSLPQTLNAFLFFFMIYTGALPATIASYSLVGEKIERSLEPLLATPVTDGEVLAGKGLAAFLPPIAAVWAASV